MRDTRLRLVGLTALFTLVVLLCLLGIAATSFAQGGRRGQDRAYHYGLVACRLDREHTLQTFS